MLYLSIVHIHENLRIEMEELDGSAQRYKAATCRTIHKHGKKNWVVDGVRNSKLDWQNAHMLAQAVGKSTCINKSKEITYQSMEIHF